MLIVAPRPFKAKSRSATASMELRKAKAQFAAVRGRSRAAVLPGRRKPRGTRRCGEGIAQALKSAHKGRAPCAPVVPRLTGWARCRWV